jgi:DNA polymerase-1
MTASAGLHNMPAALRPAVVAADGHVFVRADLGQIEPRVLAAVSRDQALTAATRADDLYAPVAAQLGVGRPTAKVAVLGAMYGQTTGHGAQALRRLNAAYPVAMAYLDAADRAGRAGRDLRTYGGRLIVLAPSDPEPRSSSRAAAYGRYARNAMIQGAAAELFKMWAVTVRARCGHAGRADRAVPARRAAGALPPRAGGRCPGWSMIACRSRGPLGARLRGPVHLRYRRHPQLGGRQGRARSPAVARGRRATMA